ncbi:MAG: discoidin domain-containing protein [Bacteroidales bacterium]|nr:discoidin domain-containing protein [Bacteroidales bacterium]
MTHTQTNKLFLLLASLLLSALAPATRYCKETLTELNAGEINNQNLIFSASKTGDMETTFTLTSTTSQLRAIYEAVLQNPGGGTTDTDWKKDWNLADNTLTKVVQWTVYPTSPIQLHLVAYRNNAESGSDIIGKTIMDIDLSSVCDDGGGDDNPPAFDPTANLALNKPAYAGYGDNPSSSNDGNLNTRWGSSGAPKDYSCDWWYVDLGAYYQLTEIDIFWEGAYSMDFVLQGAKDRPADVTDDTAWRTLYTFSGDPKVGQAEADKNVYTVSGAARYVRIKSYANSLGNQWGMSIWEFRVYGSGLVETDDIKPVVTHAELVSADEDNASVQLKLNAEVVRDGQIEAVCDFLVTDLNSGQRWRIATTPDDNNVLLTGLVSCRRYHLQVEAVDAFYNCSEPQVLPEFDGPAGNMALGKPCQASFSQGNDVLPGKAVDGNINSRWSGWGAPVGECWWQVDLEEIRKVQKVRINFENQDFSDYTIASSVDGISWSPLVHYTTAPETHKFIDYEVPAIGRYLRISSKQPKLSFYEFEVYGECYHAEEDYRPHMIYAEVENVTTTTADIAVSAVDDTTPFAEMRYQVVLTQGGNQYDFTTTATDGILHFQDIPQSALHTAQIWAIDADGNQSDNAITVSFTTLGDYVELYLSGTMNGWALDDPDYKFRTTSIPGIYKLTVSLANHHVYKLTDGNSWNPGHCTTNDHHFNLPSEGSEVTFYARGVNNFASSADSIFVVGTLVSGGWNDMHTDAVYAEWQGEQAVWVGDVNLGGEYKIVKVAFLDGTTDGNMPYVYWNDLYEANQKAGSLTTAKAQFVFDLPTLSWTWTDYHAGYCSFFGAAGDGLIRQGQQDIAFSTGYKLEMWPNEMNDAIVVQLTYLDTDKEAANAIFLNYPELQIDRVNETYLRKVNNHLFQGEVPMDNLTNRADGMIRFSVKLELPEGQMRLTTPEYFYLDGSGCAERIFVIYHHDDLPAEPEHGALAQFAGGHILQPIQYKRLFKPGIWETLSLPFEVAKVTVYDPADNEEYDLYAQYTDDAGATKEGNFWLRTFDAKAAEVVADDFKSNWKDIRAISSAEALPKKDVPYIMMMPAGDYYDDKYVIFHGAGYQEIDSKYEAPSLPQDDYFSYSGNNTMMPWRLQSAYVLDAVGAYFESGETVTLQPFECAVNATQATIRRLPRLGLNAQTDVTTADVLPTTHLEGEIYGVMGQRFGAFASLDAYEALLRRLPAGFYIVRMGTQVTKIYVEDAL